MGKKKLVDASIQTDISLNPMNFVYRTHNKEPKNLLKNIKTNWIFYITLLLCCIILSIKSNNQIYSFFKILISIIFVSFLGYFIHFFSHFVSFTDLYKSSNNYLHKNIVTDTIFKYLCKFMDFHDKIHHNTEINKEPEDGLSIIERIFNKVDLPDPEGPTIE